VASMSPQRLVEQLRRVDPYLRLHAAAHVATISWNIVQPLGCQNTVPGLPPEVEEVHLAAELSVIRFSVLFG